MPERLMVGPSTTDDERRTAALRFRAGFVLLVGLSGGLVAVSVGATTTQIVAVVAGGLVAGAALMWWLVRSYRQIRPGS